MNSTDKIRQKGIEELKKDLNLLREKLAHLNFNKEMGSLKKFHQIKETKKNIAQNLTIIKEKMTNSK